VTFGRFGFCIVLLVLTNLTVFAQYPSISTFVGSPPFPTEGGLAADYGIGFPIAVISDGAGGVYIATSHNRIYRVSVGAQITWIAGTIDDSVAYDGDGGPATAAHLRLVSPSGGFSYNAAGLALDSGGNLYIADTINSRVRKVTNGVITTVAGNGQSGFSGDGGPAQSAQLRTPSGLAVDASGNLYIADTFNQRIRKVTTNGLITTIAGSGSAVYNPAEDGGPATSGHLFYPQGLALDGANNLYVADTGNERIRKITPTGIISTVAGKGYPLGYSGDGGPAIDAQFYNPAAVALDNAGNLYIADTGNGRIRTVTPNGLIGTFAGNGMFTGGIFAGDGGPATDARLNNPTAVAVDTSGNVFIADQANLRIRSVSSGVIRTIAGNGTEYFGGDSGPATASELFHPPGIATDSSGNLYIADSGNYRIRKVTTAGVTTTVAGNGTVGFSGDGGPATSAQLAAVNGVAVDSAGNIYIADTGNHRIRKVSPQGVITTIAGTGEPGYGGDGGPATAARLTSPSGVAVDTAGDLLLADTSNNRIRKVTDGVITTIAGNGEPYGYGENIPATQATLNSPFGVAVDAAGTIYIADTFNQRIRKVTRGGVISTVVGREDDESPAIALFPSYPTGVAADALGNIYVTDTNRNRVQMLTVDGLVLTIAGSGPGGYSGDGGSSAAAQLNLPRSVTVDAARNVFVSDLRNNRIRKIELFSPLAETPYSISNLAGISRKTMGESTLVNTGYARMQPDSGTATPAGLAIFGFRKGNVLVSETSVPATPALNSGRIYAEIIGPLNTGIAIVNPNNSNANIDFFFTNSAGTDVSRGNLTIPANAQLARFLDQMPFNRSGPFQGTFTFTSNLPVGVIALRGLINERGDFLMSTLPVINPIDSSGTPIEVIPHYADGGGWTTQVLLVNPTDTLAVGDLQFLDPGGAPANVALDGKTNTTFEYSVPPRSSQKLTTAGAAATTVVGSIRVSPKQGPTPTPMVVFSRQTGGITISEAAVNVTTASVLRMYVESSGTSGEPGNIQSGLAIANPSASPVTVTIELTQLDGSRLPGLDPASINLTGFAQVSKFLVDLFPTVANPFKGVLRIVSNSSALSVVGLRGHYNERRDFLITTTPPVIENDQVSPPATLFPHLADGGGYITQFILFSRTPGPVASGRFHLYDPNGRPLNLTLR
jgi:trimeric autotransporter adhesin